MSIKHNKNKTNFTRRGDNRSPYNYAYHSIFTDDEANKKRLWKELNRNHHPGLPDLHDFILMPYNEIYTRFDFFKKWPERGFAHTPEEAFLERFNINKRLRLRRAKKNYENNKYFFNYSTPSRKK